MSATLSRNAQIFRGCRITSQKYEQGSEFSFDIYVPPQSRENDELALYLLLEQRIDILAPLLDTLMQEGLVPFGMIIFCSSGWLNPSMPYGDKRRMRAEELDQFGVDFSNFLIEELIPEACRIANTTLSSSPDMHFISGASSGGLAAWNAVWFRNDYFRRAFLSSPTFSAMRGGEEAMVLVRKTESKPIKLYMTVGTEEPDYFFGSSLIAATNAASALEFAGYDFRFEQFNGEGHGCRREDPTLWRRMMGFIWANWKSIPVITLGKQIRIRHLVADDAAWEVIEGAFPEKPVMSVCGGVYSFKDGDIFFEKNGTKQIVASGFGRITALGLSSDLWRLYIADESRRFIFAMSIQPDGSLTNLYKHAPMHLAYDFRKAGASDIAVLSDDRVLAATELGIQGIISFGIVDLILPLPGDLPAERVTIVGNTLYVASGDKLFTRRLKVSAPAGDGVPVPPSTPQYGDGFSYNRSHLFFA